MIINRILNTKLIFIESFIIKNMKSKSQLNIEDQKSIIVSQLQNQVLQLKKNQQQYHNLKRQLKRLEFKYQQLFKQKLDSQQQYSTQRQSTKKLIREYQLHLQDIKSQINQKMQQMSEIEKTGILIQEDLVKQQQLIQNVVEQHKYLKSVEVSMDEQQELLNIQIEQLKRQKQKLNRTYQKYEEEQKTLLQVQKNTQNGICQLQASKKIIKSQILSIEMQNSHLQSQISSLIQQKNNTETKISHLNNQLRSINNDIMEVKQIIDKTKAQASNINKSTYKQLNTAKQYNRTLQNIQHIQKIRIQQIKQLQQQLKQIRNEIQQLYQLNRKLENDNFNCQQYIEVVSCQNNYLIEELSILAEEDQKIIKLIRKGKMHNGGLSSI